MERPTGALPTQHSYRGLSITKLIGLKLRVLAKFCVMLLKNPRQRRERLLALRRLRGTQGGESILVLGLGPSAGNLSIEAICERQAAGNLKVISVNHFFESSFARKMVPDYYVLADPYFFGKHSARGTNWHDVWEYLSAHPEITVFVPERYDAPADAMPQRLFYFNSLGLEGFSKSIDPTRPRGYLSMTVYSALSLAGFLGFSRILISGIDNTQFRALRLMSDMTVGLASNHFYDGTVKIVRPLTHFPDGVPAFFEDVGRLFKDLHLFRSLPIENLDPETLVDAFPIAEDWVDYSRKIAASDE